MSNIFVFTLIKISNDNSENKEDYPYKKLLLFSLIPIFNILIEFILLYQVLKQAHNFITDKEQRKYAISLLIIGVLFIALNFIFSSILNGVISLIAIVIIAIIIIKG